MLFICEILEEWSINIPVFSFVLLHTVNFVNLNTRLYIYLDYISSCYPGEIILDPDTVNLCVFYS